MSDDDLLTRLTDLRKRREKLPTKKLVKEKQHSTKVSAKGKASVDYLLSSFDERQLNLLLEKLQEGEGA